MVDLTGEIATVLRPGMVSPEQIRDVLGEVRTTAAGPRSGDALKSPGQPLHYSPKARVILAGEDWKKSLGQSGTKAYIISTEPPPADLIWKIGTNFQHLRTVTPEASMIR